MDADQKMLIVDRRFHDSYDKSLAGKVSAAITKLVKDPSAPGLHVEPIQGSKDERVRTAHVDQNHRMVFFDLGPAYLLHGVYPHEQAYRVAVVVYARVNPRSGALEIRRGEADALHPTVPSPENIRENGRYITDSELKALKEEVAAKALAEHQDRQAAAEPVLLGGYRARDLVEHLGVQEELAEYAVAAAETELLDKLALIDDWQSQALMDLATGTPMPEVKENYIRSAENVGGTEIGVPSDSEDVVRAAQDPHSESQFRLLRDDQALKDALEGGDFDAWRLFLHPDQKRYVEMETSGPFRLSGGAGTGKTVVLVHRAVRLARQNPEARILVVSYTKNLTALIGRQIHDLDPGVKVNPQPGRPGICVQTLDAVASHVLRQAGDDPRGKRLPTAMNAVLGWGTPQRPGYRTLGTGPNAPWNQAVDIAGDDLPELLHSSHFFETEYSEIILPLSITDLRGYIRAPRMGRGTRLGRAQRQAVWDVVEQYRRDGATEKKIDWSEAAAVAAAVQRGVGLSEGIEPPEPLADHVLVDEAQDLSPTRWLLARAIVAEGPNDLFVAEDANQRIYGNRIVLSRFGIHVRGRSRRLRLNYRTTEQNLQWALKVLDGGNYDLDEAEDGSGSADTKDDRYLSSRLGPEPDSMSAAGLEEEYQRVASLLQRWIEELEAEGMDPSTLGILVRTTAQRSSLVRAMGDRGVHISPVEQEAVPKGAPVAMTLHRAKGTEFSRVLLFDVSEASIPKHYAGTGYDEQALEDNELRERSLLYVGATRARDMLAISWSKKASPFLPEAR